MAGDDKKREISFFPRSYGSGGRSKDRHFGRRGGGQRDGTHQKGEADPKGEDRLQREHTEDNGVNPSAEENGGSLCPEDDLDTATYDEEVTARGEEPSLSCLCPLSRMDEAVGEGEFAAQGEQSVRVKVRLAGVRFEYAGRIYYFELEDIQPEIGDWVIVKTDKGLGMGQIVLAPFVREIDAGQLQALRKVLRPATEADFDQQERCRQREAVAKIYCLHMIEKLQLPMKLVGVECFFDGTKYVFYFTSEGRVDFRELVKLLVARFPVRIEMRQIGVRHESKMIGGIASCGQELCCSRYLVDFRPVSVKMAKNQNLSLNPSKISGACGRLMCCLAYEYEIYEEFKKGLPKVGKTVNTARGVGVVLRHNPLTQSVTVQFGEADVIDYRKEELLKGCEPTTSASGSDPTTKPGRTDPDGTSSE
ncbi:MAG: stage 0 sporulation family protein [Pseudomonadota bacterium]